MLSICTEINNLSDPAEWPLRTLFQNVCIFGANRENLNKDRPTSSEEVASEVRCTRLYLESKTNSHYRNNFHFSLQT